jgi:two-component system response regulator RegX3
VAAPCVLVIDDEPHVRELWCDFFRFLRCEVEEAASGIEGLERFEHGHYDLVVSDLLMPGLNGWDLARTVRQAGSVPVVLVTGDRSAIDVGLLQEPGILLFQKPISLIDFRSVVERLLPASMDQAADPDSPPSHDLTLASSGVSLSV